MNVTNNFLNFTIKICYIFCRVQRSNSYKTDKILSIKENPWMPLVILLILSTLVPLWILVKQIQPVTGDEPRYIFVGVFSGRLISLIVGLCGLTGLFLLLRQISSTGLQAFFIALLVALTLPTLPYLSLALPEITLFTGVAWILYLFGRSNTGTFALIALLLIAMTFFHLRALELSFGVLILFFARQFDEYGYQFRWSVWYNFFIFILIITIGLTSLEVFNLPVYGNLSGALSTTKPVFSDLGVASALIGARHGLLTYAPIWIMAVVGLILGCLRGDIWAIRSSVLLGFMVVSFIGIDAGESWPARFWVMTIPALTIGLLLAWRYSSYAGRTLFIILAFLSLLNTLTYVIYPSMYLENRQVSRVYNFWHEKIPAFHFGIPLIVVGQPWHGQAILLLVFIGAAIQSVSQKKLYMRWGFTILFLAGFLGTALVESVDSEIHDKESDYVDIRFKDISIADGVFLLGIYQPWWYFSPQANVLVNNTQIPIAPVVLLDLYGRPELTLTLPPESNNWRRSPVIILRARAPWVRWLSMGNQVWKS